MAIIATQATVYYASAVFYQNEAAGSLAAWKAAILTKDGSGRYRINADGALVRVMHAYNAWSGMTSSVVERGLSSIQAAIKTHRRKLAGAKRFSEIKVKLDIATEACRRINTPNNAFTKRNGIIRTYQLRTSTL